MGMPFSMSLRRQYCIPVRHVYWSLTDGDLVILDINLPGMNGIDIYQHIKEINPKQPTLFMTGYSAYGFPDLDDFDLGILEKPFKLDELGHKIQEFYDSF